MTVFGLLLGLGGGAYAALLLALYLGQNEQIFRPEPAVASTPEALGLHYEPVRLTAEDGVALRAWAVPHTGSDHWVLFLHGNAGNRGDCLGRIAFLHRLGFNVLVPDYRGYGGSEGRPSEAGVYRDAAAAWTHLVRARGVDPAQLLVYGHSLGGAVAAWLAAHRSAAGLVIEGGFPELAALAGRKYPYVPVDWLLRHRFPTAEHVARVRVPVLVAHSRDDEVVPYALGQVLFEHVRAPRHWAAFDGLHDTRWEAERGPYGAALKRFAATLWPERAVPSAREAAL